ncbi:hypothetical protein IJJ53_02455 [Candidatus Saccharibacteria bacterium]|nr:hypothetical protein [Candidatus Saccharibacteria bacterium]
MRCKKNITYNIRNITFSLQNIISFFRNLIGHFTDKEKILTLSFRNITLYSLILTLSSINIINTFPYIPNTSALSYQSSTDVKFTFNPTLSINISSSDLIIDNLTPGTVSDSNVINVSVATNASHGYTLAATVGDSLHNNTNLTHTNGTNTFDSIATNSSLPNLTTDNTWGYSYKLSNNTTWNNYSGLSNETSKILVNTDNQLAKPIDFKIAAKAAETQPSGTYTNTINFITISKPIPKTIEDIVYMQTFGELLPTDLQTVKDSMEEEHTYTLKDARDEQDYTIAKLKDGKIWMTKNLNLAGGTEITSELSDVPEGYTLPTDNGFQEGNRLPESSQTGFSDNTQAYVYNTGNNTDNCARPGCYSYYSWHAATAGSGVGITANNANAPYSICPKGWRLPNVSGLDFANLVAIYGSGTDFYNNAGPSTIPNFLLAGFYRNSYFENGNSYGGYWSSKRYSNTMGINLAIYRSTVSFGNALQYYVGMSIRCLAR